MSKLLAVILSGGAGQRLWPLSIPEHPKQFLKLLGEKTLFQQTIQRIASLPDSLPPLIICNQAHESFVTTQLAQQKYSAILLEPIGRNTAPAIALAAMQAMTLEEDPLLLILPSDHLIQKKNVFIDAVNRARRYAEENKIVTFGIVPDKPETGFGYIQSDKEIAPGAFSVASFVEKPNLETAKKYLTAGNYYWNSGMFMFRASRVLKDIQQCTPEVYEVCQKVFAARKTHDKVMHLDEKLFATCPKISIDYAVMEKTSEVVVMPVDMGWSDVGSWSKLLDVVQKDKAGNAMVGKVLEAGLKGSYVFSKKRPVMTLGVENLIIVESENGVLVMHKDHDQGLKSLVEKLSEQ